MSMQKIKKLLAEQLGYSDENEIKSNLSLFEDLKMNGDDYDEFIYNLESEFDIEIDENAIEGFEYVKDITNYIKKNIR